jgi:CDP-glycerol glycerophosphotransferase (TagB/SpsB family)
MFIKKILLWFLETVVAIAPKFNWCVLRGFPDYDDNCLAIYERLPDYGCRKIIWIVSDPSAARPFQPYGNTIFVKRNSMSDYFFSSLAKYLFITHGHFLENIPANQMCVNLWHGIPYKVIGKLDGKAGRSDSMVVATSPLTREVFAQVFDVDRNRVVITGQARTDRMFVDRKQVRARLGLAADSSTKIFLWLPTYRKTSMAGGRLDGKDSGNVFNCAGFPTADFDAYLKANDAICLVKPHPMAPAVGDLGTDNLRYISDSWLREKGLTLYQLAGITDCMVSDISSIVIDFLLMDKPVVLLFEDIAEYRSSRGFVFSPVENWLPARVNIGYGEFIDDLDAVMAGQDRYASERQRLKAEFFEHHDNRSAIRILDRAWRRTPA